MKRIKKEDLMLLINRTKNYYNEINSGLLPELMELEDKIRALYKLSFHDMLFIAELSRYSLRENKTDEELIKVLEILDIEVYD